MNKRISIYLDQTSLELSLGFKDDKGWWAWYESIQDFVHIDFGPNEHYTFLGFL